MKNSLRKNLCEKYFFYSDSKRKKFLYEKIYKKRFSIFEYDLDDLNDDWKNVINDLNSNEKIINSLKKIHFFLLENCEIDEDFLLEKIFNLIIEKENLNEIIIYIFQILNVFYENKKLKHFLLNHEFFLNFFHKILHNAIFNMNFNDFSNDFFLYSNIFKFYNFLNLISFDLFLKSFNEKTLKIMLEILIKNEINFELKFEILSEISDYVSNKNDKFTFYLKKCEIYKYLIILFENSENLNEKFLKEMFFLLCNLIVGENKNFEFIFNSCIINKIFYYLKTKNLSLKIEIFWCCAQFVSFDNEFLPFLIKEKNFLKNVIFDCLSLKQSQNSKVFFCIIEALVEILKIFEKNKNLYEKYFYQIFDIKNKMEEIYFNNNNNNKKIDEYLNYAIKKIEKFEKNLIN